MKYLWIYLLFALSGIHPLVAQTGQREDIAELLDDGGISEARNLLKFNVLNPLAGDLSLAYERKLSNRFTLQINAGKVVPFFLTDLSGPFVEFALADPAQDLSNLSGGFSFGITPKFYLKDIAPEFYYLGIDYQYRRYRRDSQYDLTFTDYQVLTGYNVFFGTRFVLELYTGLGVRSVRYQAHPGSSDLSVLNRIIPNLPIGLRLGVIL